ncbi:MAG: alpha/beta fold hydrolase [Anaerolineae bacterium]
MSHNNPHLAWIAGYTRRGIGRFLNTYTTEYKLSYLMRKGYIDRQEAQQFLDESGLADFHWELTWPEDFEMPDEMLVDRIANVQGYVVWVHGWTGNLHIWEDLPARVVNKNRRLVSIAIDHNGFGESVFVDNTPDSDTCNPPAAMRTLKRFIDLIKIRRQPGQVGNKVINLVGHSMGGATLFYLNPMQWNYGEVTRCAIAPALLLEDESQRAFYQTLGLGIGIVQRIPVLEVVERFIKPGVLRTLASGASEEVKHIHDIQYNETPRGITGATFMALGRLKDTEIAHDFDLMQVMLGHKDPLVGLVPMIDLLGNLEFPAANIHVVPGTHYMFSVGKESPTNAYHHAQAREILVQDILNLHEAAVQLQKIGPRFG